MICLVIFAQALDPRQTKKKSREKVGVDARLKLKVQNLLTIVMGVNVGVNPIKSKSVRYSRTARRLVGYVRYRVRNAKAKPWIRLDLADFAKLAQVNIKTARRCLDTIRNDVESDIVVRTCHENRRWMLLCSTTARLSGLKRSEPLASTEDGKKRIIKTKKNGSTIAHQQLIVGSDGVYWHEEPSQQEEDTQNSKSSSCHPKQGTLNLLVEDEEEPVDLSACWRAFLSPRVTDISEPVVIRGVSDKSETKTNTQRGFGDASHRLAFAIARRYLEPLHYDNCKIGYEIAMAFSYCKRALKNGCTKQDIIRCYDLAMHDCHAMAVDTDPLASAGSWRASSTIHRAERLLVARSCHGKWKRISAQQEVVEIV